MCQDRLSRFSFARAVRWRVVLAVAAVVGCAPVVSADTFFVPQDFPTIQAAINAAANGDTVIIQSGTYTERLDTLGKELRINGVAINSPTLLGPPGAAIIRVRSTAGVFGIEMRNLTIRGGDAALGGAIQVDANARLRITDSRLWQNTAGSGGAMILGTDSTVEIARCDFWLNTSDASGGAIFAFPGVALEVEDTLFEANSGPGDGGAIWMSAGSIGLRAGVRFLRNAAGDVGGALTILSGVSLVADGTEFESNTASGSGGGGAIYADGATLETTQCTFLTNTASGPGGALRLISGASAGSLFDRFEGNRANSGGAVQSQSASFVANLATMVDNEAAQNGGAISSVIGSGSVSVLRLYNSRISGNSAGIDGGGINMVYSSVSEPISAEFLLANSLVHHNHADAGVGGVLLVPFLLGGGTVSPTVVNSVIAFNTGADAANGLRIGVVAAQVHNTIAWNNQGADLAVAAGSVVTRSIFDGATSWPGAGNINANPLFRNAAAGDFSVRSGSPAIDAGDNTRVPADLVDDDADGNTAERLPLDFPGLARFHNDPATADTGVAGPSAGSVVDIGAYEFPRSCLADFAEPLGSVDFFDLTAFLAAFNARNASADLVAPAGVWNFFDISAFLAAFNAGCP